MGLGLGRRYLLGVAFAVFAAPSTTPVADISRYRVLWNSPWPLKCGHSGSSPATAAFNFSRWSVEANGNGNGSMTAYSGRTITLWNSQLGLYPSIDKHGAAVNGGIPQVAVTDLSAHLAKLAHDVTHGLMEKGVTIAQPLAAGFDGLGVIDWEAWPLAWRRFTLAEGTPATDWRMNASVALVLADHPDWRLDKAEQEAGRRWDAAAETFISATLATLRRLRPQGKFGIFGYPDCDGHFGLQDEALGCAVGFREMNDRDLAWLWKASSALFVNSYIFRPPGRYCGCSTTCHRSWGCCGAADCTGTAAENVTFASNRRMVDNQLAEGMRVAVATTGSGSPPPMYAFGRASFYARCDYHGSTSLMQHMDLETTVRRPSAHGVAGVVLWGAVADCSSAELCAAQEKYIANALGPASAEAITVAEKCAQQYCSGGRGACITIDSHGRKLPRPSCTNATLAATAPTVPITSPVDPEWPGGGFPPIP